MERNLQQYACPLCNGNASSPVLRKHGLSIVKCGNCGFVYVNPRLNNEELTSLYIHNYFRNKEYGYAGYELQEVMRKKNFTRWLADVTPFMPTISGNGQLRTLDVGCAAGYCLDVMKEKGWEASGIELEEEMFAALKLKGYQVNNTKLEDFDSPVKYSLITLFDVIEHIPDPDRAFKRLHSLLEADGIIIMITPDHASLQRKIFGKRWFQYKPIEHIHYFTRETLSVFAERNGLKMTWHSRSGQYADAGFILNRLRYYGFPGLYTVFDKLFSWLNLKKKFFYTDTGSLLAVFTKK